MGGLLRGFKGLFQRDAAPAPGPAQPPPSSSVTSGRKGRTNLHGAVSAAAMASAAASAVERSGPSHGARRALGGDGASARAGASGRAGNASRAGSEGHSVRAGGAAGLAADRAASKSFTAGGRGVVVQAGALNVALSGSSFAVQRGRRDN